MLDKIVGKKVIGVKQCQKLIKNGNVLYVAKDAISKLVLPLIELAKENNVEIVEIPTMKELGKMSGIDVKSAATLVLKD